MDMQEIQTGLAERAVMNAMRDLLHVKDAGGARDIAIALVHELGGDAVAATDSAEDAVPVDLSFGAGPPLLARPGNDVARLHLERFLPAFVGDGTRALALVHSTDRLAIEADFDPLTGLGNRRATGRALGRLKDGDIVVLIDLDRFKQLNDTLGHEEGDRVLTEFGATLRGGIRQQDHAGRRGGDEFILLIVGATVEDVSTMCDRLRTAWEARRPHPVGFSAGFAPKRPGANAVVAADRALYRAKELGRDQAQAAHDEDYR